MADRILKDVAQLSSTLTEVASRQLEAVLGELRASGENQRAAAGGGGREGGSLSSVAGNVMQIVNQVGSLLMQLSEYDLVKSNANVLTLSSTNAISSITVRAGEETLYPLLIENNGRVTQLVIAQAMLHPGDRIFEDKVPLEVGERKSVPIRLPGLPGGKTTLIISVSDGDKVVARKTVAINVLPPPKQHGA